MRKILLQTILLLFIMGCNNRVTQEPKEETQILNIDPLECAYYIKPNKEYPHGDMLTFPNCGKLVNGELQLSKKHLENMSFKKGSEAEFDLSTIYAGYPHVFYVTKEGRTKRMYFFDMGADYFSEGLARYLNSENKMGFISSKLHVVIPARYDYATSFKNGVAIVSNGSHSEKVSDSEYEEHTHMVGGLWGAIDKKGAVVVPLKYGSEGEVQEFLKKKKD